MYRKTVLDNGIRVGAVSHQVAGRQDPVVQALGVGQHRLERLSVGVYVAQDQVRHSWIMDTSGVAPMRAGTPTVPMPRVT